MNYYVCQSTISLGSFCLINHGNQKLTHKVHVNISDCNCIHFICYLFFLPYVLAELITVSLPFGKSEFLAFWRLAEKTYTDAYSVNLIHKTWNYLCLPPNVGIRTNFIDIYMFIVPDSCPSLVLSCPTFKYIGGSVYLQRPTTEKFECLYKSMLS